VTLRACVHACMHACMRACVRACMSACVRCICVRACKCVCISLCVRAGGLRIRRAPVPNAPWVGVGVAAGSAFAGIFALWRQQRSPEWDRRREMLGSGGVSAKSGGRGRAGATQAAPIGGRWGQMASTYDFRRQQPALRHHTRQVARCLEAAADEAQGRTCLADYFSLLPHDIVEQALDKGLRESKDVGVATDATQLSNSLRGCIDVAGAWAGALFCVEDLIANIPRTLVRAAVSAAKAHPAFDYTAARHAGAREGAIFSSCVHHARGVHAGTACLSALLGELPRALSARAVTLASNLPPPQGAGLNISPQHRAQQLAKCLFVARASDGAVYCLADYLRSLPSRQLDQAWSAAKLQGKQAAVVIKSNLPPLKTEKDKVYWERRYLSHTFPLNAIGLHKRHELEEKETQ
jgi:hypothetical protein